MATENTSPRRSGADWFGLAAFAVLLISSAVLVIRLISTRFLSTGHLLLASGALLVLSGLHGWVQLPRRNKTGGKTVCGVIALLLSAAMIYGAAALTSVQHAITDIADKSAETDITCVIVNADGPAQSIDDIRAICWVFWRTGTRRIPSPCSNSFRRSWARRTTRPTPPLPC